MNNLPVTVQAVADTSRAAKSLENLTRKREVILAASFDARSIAAANKPLGAIKRSADEFEKSMAAANARVLAFGTSVAVIEGMRRSFLSLIKTTADVERSLTQIAVVARDDLQKAGISIEEYGSKIFDLAKKTGQSFDIASKATLEFSRQGIGLEESAKRTQVALELARISGAEYTDVVQGMTAAYNSFGSETLTFSKIAEKLVNVDNKTTTSLKGLFDVLSRTSSIAKTTGTSFEELLAVTATLKDVTGRSESVIGNAFKSISTKIASSDVLDKLVKEGIQVRDVNTDELLKPIEILKNVAKAFESITDASKKADITRAIGGLYQADQLNALLVGLTQAADGTSLYGSNAEKAAQDVNALSEANKAFSENLINKFNAVDVTIQQVLNSLGKIGVKNPLGSLLDGITEIGEGFTKFIDGDEIGSGLARGIVKGLGAVLLGPTGVVTVGFIIAKIIKDFGVFAFDAAKSFLSLNKTAKDQELIQKSILTTISQMPSILNGIENTESGRLLLAQRVSAEYERQLSLAATLNNIAKGAAQSVYGQGFRITDKGLTKGKRASNGYLPDLISSEMRDVKSGVGGANPNSKIVVMPNFPFGGGKKGLMVANSSEVAMKMGDGYGILNPDMMGQRSANGFLAGQKLKTSGGRFASVNNIQEGLQNLVQLLVGMNKSLPEIREASKNFAKSFQLNEKSLDLVVDASARYASSVREASERIARETSQEAIRKAIGKADQTIRSAPEKRGAFTPPIIVPSGGTFINRPSPREIENALKESSLKMIVEAADAANQKIFDGILEKRKQIAEYIKKNPPNPLALGLSRTSLPGRDLSGNPTFAYLNQPIRYSGPTSSDPLTRATEIGRQREIDRLATQQRGLSVAPTLVEAARIRQNYQYNPTAAFGGTQRLASQTLPSSVALPAETLKKATGSLESFAIKTFAASAIVDIVGAQFRGMSGTTDKLIDALSKATLAVAGFSFLNRSGGLGAGKDSKKILPILGQIGIVGFAINEFSKVFSDKSFFDRIKEAWTGVTDVGEKTKIALEEFSASLYQSGQFIGSSRESRISQASSQRNLALQELKAESLGVKGDTPEKTSANLLRKGVEDFLSSQFTGVTIGEFGYQGVSILDRVSGDAKENLISGLSVLVSGTAQEISDDLSKLGITKINGQNIDKVPIEKAREVLIEEFIKNLFGSLIKDNQVNLQNIFGGNKGKANVFGYVEQFTRGLSPKQEASVKEVSGLNIFSNVLGAGGGIGGIFSKNKDIFENIYKLQSDLQLSIIDGTISSLESQIKSIEARASSSSISESEKQRLLNVADEIKQKVFVEQLKVAGQEFQTASNLSRTSGKTQPEIDAELTNLSQKYSNQVNSINDSIQASKLETTERKRTIDSLRDFNLSLSSLETALSSLSVLETQADAKINLLQARSGNPSLSIGSQESFQRQANQEQINKLQTVNTAQAIARLNQSIVSAGNETDEIKQKAIREQALKAFDAEISAINGQVLAIEESTKQIGATKSSFVSLNDAILQFTRNLGESRGQNQFNLLQATDSSSIVQGLIGEQVYGAAEGKSGQDLVSFIADQNALLNEQFKIRTASSETERLELERQLDLTTQILDIKNSNLSASEKQAAIEGAINSNLEKRRTFSSGLQDAAAEMKTRVNNFGNEFGKTTANAFRDGLSDAIKAAVSQTDNLKDALLDIALAFANKLRDAAIDNVVDSLMSGSKGGGSGLLGGILGFFTGARGYAKGGQVTGGSGNKDDVPTLLTGGEYVIPKDVVNAYGKTFFDRIRDGSVGKMASGGFFAPGVRGQGSIVGKENLINFAGQTATSGAQDVRQTLRGGAGLVSLEPESIRATNFQRFGDSPILQATQDAKDQALGLYFDQLGQEKQYQEELAAYFKDIEESAAAKKKAQKDKKKQLIMSLATAVIGGAISSFGGGAKTGGGEKRYSGGTIRGVSERPYSFSSSKTPTQSFSSGFGVPFKNSSPYSGSSFSSSYTPSTFDLLNYGKDILGLYSGKSFSDLITKVPYRTYGGASLLLPSPSYTPYRNSGGYGNGDTRQAMLSKDEFVLNSSAAKNLGDKNLYALNNGATPSGQSDDSAILAKLDELIQKTSGSNSVSVTVNSNTGDEQSSSQGDNDSNQKNRLLTEQIKVAVLQIMQNEKRPGGLLTR